MFQEEDELTGYDTVARERRPTLRTRAMIRRILCSPCYLLGILIFSAGIIALVAAADILFSSGEFGNAQLKLFVKYVRVLGSFAWQLCLRVFIFIYSLYATFR